MKPSVISDLSFTGGCLSVSYAILAIDLDLPWYICLYHVLGCLGCVAAYMWASELEGT